MHFVLFVFYVFLGTIPGVQAEAATSNWANSVGGRMRLIVLGPDAHGLRRAALQIEPQAGWFTYWREPGDSGIPPQLSLDDGQSFSVSALKFPVPKRMTIGKSTDVGYDQAVTFPFTVQGPLPIAEQGRQLKASAFIGMCNKICIPFQASFTLDLSHETASNSEEAMTVALAEQRLPSPQSDDFRLTSFVLSPNNSSLTVALTLPQGSSPDPRILLTGPEGYVFTQYEKLDENSGQIQLKIDIPKLPHDYQPAGKTWTILVAAGNHRCMETSFTLPESP